MEQKMTQTDLAFRRMYNQRIIGPKFEQPEAVARWMGALQAQDYAQGIWAVGLRTRSGTQADVERAIAEKKLIRTWPMRGTIHFIPPEDAKWMLRISSARMIAGSRGRYAQLGLDESTLERGKQVFYEALQGGKMASRAEMFSLLEAAGISPAGQRGPHIIGYAAINGLICMGPLLGKQQTYVLLDEWVPDARDLSREEALAELARRYFTSHGPAALRDFAWWGGLTLKDARSGIAAAGKNLSSIAIDDREYWQASDAADTPVQDAEDVQLLPGFDEYLLGYADRSAVLHRDHAQKIAPGGNGVFRPILVAGGQVVGAWKRIVKKKGIEITLNPFTGQALPEARLRAAAERYSQFLGLELCALQTAASG